jgi:hypothetical protein
MEERAFDNAVQQSRHSTTCTVKMVIPQRSGARYFGLHCLDSDVLANWIKTSTFGRYHALPAAYMKYAGAVLGVHRASAIGDAIATAFFKIGVI